METKRAEKTEEERWDYDRLAWPSSVLTLGPAPEMETEGRASHPADISKQREAQRQQFNIFRNTVTEFPIMTYLKDTEPDVKEKDTALFIHANF